MKRTEMVRTGFKPAEPKPSRGPKQIACKNRACRKRFVPDPLWLRCCSEECGVVIGLEAVAKRKAAKEKAERAETKKKLEGLKSRSDYAALAQKAVNRYVNLRDKDKPCVSCGKPAASGGVRNASHFKSVGANSAQRFNLWNIHTSCYRCNVELSGNLGEYYPRLIERIGVEKVEYLQNSPRERRYEVDYLKRLQAIFNKKARRKMK